MTPVDIPSKTLGLAAGSRLESSLAAKLAGLMQAPRSEVQAALPQLQQAFGSSNPSLQILATVLAGRAGPAGLPILNNAQQAESTALRQFATLGMGQIGPGADVVEGLTRAMQDGDETTAKLATAALGRAKGSVASLRGLAQSSDPRVAALALGSLGHATEGTGQVAPELVAARRSADPHIAMAAAESTLRADETADDALDDLLARLRADPDAAVRCEAAAACGRLMDKATPATAPLRKALTSDPDASVRASAATALALVGGRQPETVDSLARALGDRDRAVQEAAIIALSSLEDKAKTALPALQALDQVADDEMRPLLEAAIDRIGGT